MFRRCYEAEIIGQYILQLTFLDFQFLLQIIYIYFSKQLIKYTEVVFFKPNLVALGLTHLQQQAVLLQPLLRQ